MNWKLLEGAKYNESWDYIFNNLQFHPVKVHEKLITFHEPFKKYDISKFYNEGFQETLYDDLHLKTVKCFNEISEGRLMYALNWQHDCYSFDTNLPFEKDEFDEWLIPVFPNGDYLFFLSYDFEDGIFADGINCVIYIYGDKMIKAFDLYTPKMFL